MSGSLSRARNQPFETYLTTDEGLRFGLFGKGSSLESRIRTLRDLRIPLVVELSGTLIEPHEVNAAAFVVVSDIRASTQAATPPMTSTAVPAASTPSPTPVATLDPQVQGVAIPLAIIRFNLVNLRSAPASTAAPSGRVLADTACDILGRNAANTWFKIDCIDGSEGWIDKRLVEVQGVAENLPVVDSANQETGDALVTPSPTLPATAATPTATPDAPVDRWRATYYNNGQLSGDPVYATSVETLDFDWGVSSPHISVSPLNYSARYERAFDFAPGYYRFQASADDGVRVYLDGALMIDEWGGSTGKSYTAGRELSGRHYVTVEHYQGTGSASLRFDFEYMGSVLIWEANYYRGTTPGGKPELTRREPRTLRPIDHTWGSGSPLPALFGKGSWSAQWEGNFFFQGGTYIFHANADDGVRIYLNNILVLDKWRDGYHEVQNRFVGIGAGEHTIRVEYYEVAGEATLQVWWSRETTVN